MSYINTILINAVYTNGIWLIKTRGKKQALLIDLLKIQESVTTSVNVAYCPCHCWHKNGQFY